MKNEKPILFSGEMVRAILEGRKTQTRRVIKHQPVSGNVYLTKDDNVWAAQTDRSTVTYFNCKHGWKGDRLWVKETFMPDPYVSSNFIYRATEKEPDRYSGNHWKPSIFCTRKASRITLEITAVRVERLQDISEADAKAEGCRIFDGADEIETNGKVELLASCRRSYAKLWESINGAGSWDKNPWVWVIEFKRI